MKHRNVAIADPLAAWHADHLNFSQLLGLLEQEVAAFQAEAQPNYDLMLDIVYYLRHYPDRLHHPREDVAFACLVARAPDMQLPIARRLQEHRVIARAGEELLQHLHEAIEGSFVPRSIVEAAAATYLLYYRHHLSAEEEHVLPRAAQLFTAEDWAAVAAAIPNESDPLFGASFDARYKDLRRQIEREAQAGRA